MTMPPGCTGLATADGTNYDADRQGRVDVADRHVRAVKQQYGSIGLIDTGEPSAIGTKQTSWCYTCRPSRAWQAWTTFCPRCGAATSKERHDPARTE